MDSLSVHHQLKSAGEWDGEGFRPQELSNRKDRNSCNLLKLFPFHNYIITRNDIVIYLYREDRNRQLQSWIKAARTGQYVAEALDKPRPINIVEFNKIIDDAKRFIPRADLIISYEQLTQFWESTIYRILTLADLDLIPIPQARRKIL